MHNMTYALYLISQKTKLRSASTQNKLYIEPLRGKYDVMREFTDLTNIARSPHKLLNQGIIYL